jgi:hypothetical protein
MNAEIRDSNFNMISLRICGGSKDYQKMRRCLDVAQVISIIFVWFVFVCCIEIWKKNSKHIYLCAIFNKLVVFSEYSNRKKEFRASFWGATGQRRAPNAAPSNNIHQTLDPA